MPLELEEYRNKPSWVGNINIGKRKEIRKIIGREVLIMKLVLKDRADR